jgi:predicted RNA-binding protein YlxR (DUF448 family)
MPKETARKCIVSGQVTDKENLLRFTLTPDGSVVPDLKKKLPGKGAYVIVSKKTLQKAVESGAFAKAFKVRAKADLTLVEQVEHILHKQALDAVSLAKKAGCLISGMDKVTEALHKGKIAFLLEATDAGEDGHKRIMSYAKDVEIFSLFEIEELDKELAKENVVHLAFVKGPMAKMVKETFERLTSFLNN